VEGALDGEVRIATFNLENFDETAAGEWPALAERIVLMRPQIIRLRATIGCFQEVNGQERPNQPRSLLALAELLAGTNLAGAQLASTRTANNEVFDERNLVVATMFPILSVKQLRNELVDPPSYRRLTANPPDAAAITIGIERPVLHVQLDLPSGNRLHEINVHLKLKIPTDILGQKNTWRSADAWAEASFISSMKRMSQALEVRGLIDQILDTDPAAQIVVAGDFNAAPEVGEQSDLGQDQSVGGGYPGQEAEEERPGEVDDRRGHRVGRGRTAAPPRSRRRHRRRGR
jgi:endonuclease/exonuclease/phosphatase family metal-dependent hydrolase